MSAGAYAIRASQGPVDVGNSRPCSSAFLPKRYPTNISDAA